MVKGGVPGSIGGWVSITDAKKKILPPNAPYPVGFKNISNESEKTIENQEGKVQTKATNNDESSKNELKIEEKSEDQPKIEKSVKTDEQKSKVDKNDK